MRVCDYCEANIDSKDFCNDNHRVAYHRLRKRNNGKETVTPALHKPPEVIRQRNNVVTVNNLDDWQPDPTLSKEHMARRRKKRGL